MSIPEILPSPEMEFLLSHVGEWKSSMPGMDGNMQEGTETVSALGKSWIVIQGDSVGMKNVFQFGYDPNQKKIVGTFICSEMQFLWVYDGELNGNSMVMNAQGPRFDGNPGLGSYRDTYTLIDANHRTLTSEFLEDDGTWSTFMNAEYVRV